MGSIAKMKAAADLINRSDIGYNQARRWSFFQGGRVIPHKECDCSSCCAAIARLGGYKVNISAGITSANFAERLKAAGFKVISFKSLGQLEAGDFVAADGHVEYVYSKKRFFSAHIDERGNISGGRPGNQTGREVGFSKPYIRSGGWAKIVRPPAEKEMKAVVVPVSSVPRGSAPAAAPQKKQPPSAAAAAPSGAPAAPKYRLTVQTGPGRFVEPAVEDGVTWETELRDVPGKLTFSCRRDSGLRIREGNPVSFKMGERGVFYGFVFEVSSDAQSGSLKVTAYDQLRYLKNKDTYVFRRMTATQVLRKIARDFGLNLGKCANTKKKIKSLVEDNKTLFDMVQDALDLTLDSRKAMYVLYDDYGKLRLTAAANMKLKTLINHDTAQDYTYTSSIDGDTYNVVKLVYMNSKRKRREVYMAKSGKSINNWGRLQYFAKLNAKKNGRKKANAVLKLKNRVERTLSVSGAFGDPRVRAGVTLPVALKLHDVSQSGYLMVDKASHKFCGDAHTMDLTLKGGKYFHDV
jgi:hypothetical protein